MSRVDPSNPEPIYFRLASEIHFALLASENSSQSELAFLSYTLVRLGHVFYPILMVAAYSRQQSHDLVEATRRMLLQLVGCILDTLTELESVRQHS
jgi:hypothetical protein